MTAQLHPLLWAACCLLSTDSVALLAASEGEYSVSQFIHELASRYLCDLIVTALELIQPLLFCMNCSASYVDISNEMFDMSSTS